MIAMFGIGMTELIVLAIILVGMFTFLVTRGNKNDD